MRYKRRTKNLNVRLTQHEYAELLRESQRTEQPISELVRDRLFAFPGRRRQIRGVSKSVGGRDSSEGEE